MTHAVKELVYVVIIYTIWRFAVDLENRVNTILDVQINQFVERAFDGESDSDLRVTRASI